MRSVDHAGNTTAEGRPRRRPRLVRGLLVGCLLLVVVLAGFMGWGVFLAIRGPRVGEHVTYAEAPIKGLPKEATDVCYLVRAPFWPNTAYEFTISEEGFRNWAERRGWELDEVGEEPATIYRYAFFAPIDGVAGQAHVTDGLCYGWRSPHDEDFGFGVVFDRQAMRAYYHLHTR